MSYKINRKIYINSVQRWSYTMPQEYTAEEYAMLGLKREHEALLEMFREQEKNNSICIETVTETGIIYFDNVRHQRVLYELTVYDYEGDYNETTV